MLKLKSKGGKMFSSKKSKKILLSILLFVFTLAGFFFVFNSFFLNKADTFLDTNEIKNAKVLPVENELLVKFKPTTSQTKKDKFYTKHNATEKGEIKQIDVKIITLDAKDPEQKAKEIRQLDAADIEYIEPNYFAEVSTIPNDPNYIANQQSWYKTIGAEVAWEEAKGDNVIIAVVDSGVDLTHPDLKDKLVPGYDLIANDSDPTDEHGHGTKSAGTAAALSNNATGVTGGSWNSKILPIRICDSTGYCPYSAMANGIIYAADHGASVITMSVSGSTASSTLQNAVNYAVGKNVVLIASAGNNSANLVNYPAACVGAIGVGALDGTFVNRISYSNFGSGIDVASLSSAYTTLKGGGYGGFTGTSAATPYVGGLAALIKSLNPNLTVSQVTDYIIQNTTDIDATGWDQYTGWGRINYEKTIAAVKSGVLPTPINGTIAGKVYESGTNISLSGATVTAMQTNIAKTSTVTLTDGSYVLSVEPGNYDLKIEEANHSAVTLLNIGTTSAQTTTAQTAYLTIKATSDITAPIISISSPVANANVKLGSRQTISATATDNSGIVNKVEFYLDGKLINTDSATPYSYNWNVGRKLAIGTHIIAAKAYDAAGNSAVASATVNIIK